LTESGGARVPLLLEEILKKHSDDENNDYPDRNLHRE
jgi:hypothetical protein